MWDGVLRKITMLVAGLTCPLLHNGCNISATEFENMVRAGGSEALGAVIANMLIGPINALVDGVGVAVTNLLGSPVA